MTALPVSSDSRQRRLPVLLAAVVTAGALALTAVAVQAGRAGDRPALARLLAVAALVAVGDLSLLRIRFGREGNSFTWAESTVIVGAALVGWGWLALVGSGVVAARQLLAGRGWRKTAFNTATFAAGVLVARAAWWSVTSGWNVPSHLGWRAALGLLAAATGYVVWASLTVTAAVAWSRGLAMPSVWRAGMPLRSIMLFGNAAVGLGVLLLGQWHPSALVSLPVALALTCLGYRSWYRRVVGLVVLDGSASGPAASRARHAA